MGSLTAIRFHLGEWWRRVFAPERALYLANLLLTRVIRVARGEQKGPYSRILIIKYDGLGDLLYALPAIAALRKAHRAAEITLWCEPQMGSLMAENKAINRVVSKVGELQGRYDLIVEMRGTWASLLFSLVHPPLRRLDRGSVRLHNKLAGGQLHELETNWAIVAPVLPAETIRPPLALPLNSKWQQAANNFITERSLGAFALLHTEADWKYRMWPSSRFLALAEVLHTRWGLAVVFVGAPEESARLEQLCGELPFRAYTTAGILDLGGFAALAARAALFVGNESGPLHVAAAVGIPTLGLFGPGEPWVFYPPGNNVRIEHVLLPCNPCTQVACLHPANPCIARITVEDVLLQVERLFQASAKAS